jgi:hypothetical protein
MPFYQAVGSQRLCTSYISFSIKILISHWRDKKLQSIKIPAGQYVYRNTESGKPNPYRADI